MRKTHESPSHRRLWVSLAIAFLCGCGNGSDSPNVFAVGKQGFVSEPRLLHRYLHDGSDSSAYNHPSQVFGGPLFHAAYIDRAIALDGVDDYVLVPSSDALQPGVVSVEIYFKPAATLTNGSTFVPLVVKLPEDSSFGNTVDGYDIAYQDPFGTGGRIGFGIGSQSGRIRVNASATLPITADRCHHVVGTYDRKALRLYLDGEQVAATAYTGDIAYLDGPVQIGGNIMHHLILPPFQRNFFAGLIDEVSIYGRVLSPSEIAQRARRCRDLSAGPVASPGSPLPIGTD